MNQQTLWIDTWADAVRALVDACGGPKRVAAELRSDMPVDEATDWLLKTLKENRREVMQPVHVVALLKIGRRHGCDVVAAYLLDQAGYEAPRPIKIEAEVQRASARVQDWMASASREMERVQRLQGICGQ